MVNLCWCGNFHSRPEKLFNQGLSLPLSPPLSVNQVICSLARTWNADLVVVGRRGLSRVNELLRNSVSNYILHHAACPVLVVHHQASVSPESQENQVKLVS